MKPTYELWTIRREDWLPPFDVARRYQRDREGTGRTEPSPSAPIRAWRHDGPRQAPTMDQPSWVDEIDMAVTVTDAGGRIIAMNQRSVRTFAEDGGAALVGTYVLDCHPEPARSRLAQMFLTQSPHHYTISKGGQRKAIHQLPWYRDGVFAGFVELAFPIGDHLPHFDRD